MSPYFKFLSLLLLIIPKALFAQENVIEEETFQYTKTIFSNHQIDFDIPFETGLSADDFTWSATENNEVTGETISNSSEIFITNTLINTTDKNQEVVYTISALNSNVQHVVKFVVKSLPTIELNAQSIFEGDDLRVELSFSKPTVSDSVLILGLTPTTKNGVTANDIVLDDVFVVVPKGSLSHIVNIPTIDDNIEELSENLIVSIKSVDAESLVLPTQTSKVSILDNDLFPKVIIKDTAVTEGSAIQIPIYLEKPALTEVELELSFIDIDTDGDFISDKQSVIFEAGSTTPKIPVLVKTIQDSKKENDKDFGVFVSDVVEGFVDNSEDFDTGIITIHDNDAQNFRIPNSKSFTLPQHVSLDTSLN